MTTKETVAPESTPKSEDQAISTQAVGIVKRRNVSIRKRVGMSSSFRPLRSISKRKSVKPLQLGKKEA